MQFKEKMDCDWPAINANITDRIDLIYVLFNVLLIFFLSKCFESQGERDSQ